MRERVRLLGGKIAVESTPGKGSTIFVQIPLEEPVNVR
jgi:signal transduction histidine kinase